MTDLAPSYAAQPREHGERPGGQHEGRTRSDRGEDRRQRTSERASAGSRRPDRASRAPRPAGTATSVPARPSAAPTDAPVRVADPTGDLGRSVEGAPAHADIVAVQLIRTGDEVEVRSTFAGAVPEKQTGDKGMNVASFYDVDGNGMVDYEIWASLADDGWGTGYLDDRSNEASFGPSTGIEVSVEGRTLVTRFPADRIGDPETFRWSAASEWGSYQSMAASTSARDYAPDHGAARYPG